MIETLRSIWAEAPPQCRHAKRPARKLQDARHSPRFSADSASFPTAFQTISPGRRIARRDRSARALATRRYAGKSLMRHWIPMLRRLGSADWTAAAAPPPSGEQRNRIARATEAVRNTRCV